MQTRKGSATRRPAGATGSATDVPEAPARGDGVQRGSPLREAGIQAEAPMARAGEKQGEVAVTRVGFAPIVRVDAARREIELCATSEALDSHGTVFDYRASK
ncbi:MAG: hypothetical protein ACRDHP_09885, partial [Ktedonobacterales bacterium]